MVSLYFYDKKIKLPECTRLGNFNYKIFENEKIAKKLLTFCVIFDIINLAAGEYGGGDPAR